MSYSYADRRRAGRNADVRDTVTGHPSMDALRSGTAAPTQEQMGHRVDLPDVMREKMESAFGADLSAVKLYESEAVADAGASAITQGSNIAFAPGMLDFTSFGGQSLLGHEISHVVSQARGEVTGDGFLNDHSLESRADREGAMAARGEQISVPTAAMSSVTAEAASGPMQAKDKGKKKKSAPSNAPAYAPFVSIDPKQAGKVNTGADLYEYVSGLQYSPKKGGYETKDPETGTDAERLENTLLSRYKGDDYRQGLGTISNGADVTIRGIGLDRMLPQVSHSLGEGYEEKDIIEMYDDLMAPHRSDVVRDDPASFGPANERFMKGLKTLKGMQYNQLKRLEASFGTLATQLHPDDFIRMAGPRFNDYFHLTQDTADMLADAPKSVFDPENNPEDADYKALQDYYGKVSDRAYGYSSIISASQKSDNPMDPNDLETMLLNDAARNPEADPELMASIHGPSMSAKEEKAYLKGLRKRASKKGSGIHLFGKYKGR